ncbi:hypothetical protein SORBI_3004G194950 [Sorghum bicolor]|uniref:Uncharacterized protein n=1 Tax=Sorghum bicolor TaxID=4558 RepID=A0A1Z5RNQ3_SORBI|nr:hypothetical protein SORBI_3004G194950 [Sorghum bicolor]
MIDGSRVRRRARLRLTPTMKTAVTTAAMVTREMTTEMILSRPEMTAATSTTARPRAVILMGALRTPIPVVEGTSRIATTRLSMLTRLRGRLSWAMSSALSSWLRRRLSWANSPALSSRSLRTRLPPRRPTPMAAPPPPQDFPAVDQSVLTRRLRRCPEASRARAWSRGSSTSRRTGFRLEATRRRRRQNLGPTGGPKGSASSCGRVSGLLRASGLQLQPTGTRQGTCWILLTKLPNALQQRMRKCQTSRRSLRKRSVCTSSPRSSGADRGCAALRRRSQSGLCGEVDAWPPSQGRLTR